MLRTWLARRWSQKQRPMPCRKRRSASLQLEPLEPRCVPAGFFQQTNLVSDLPGMAKFTDPNLRNPWGITASPSGPFWVSDNATGLSTLYNGNTGQPQSLVVTIPPPTGGTPPAAPTGVVFNTTTGFTVSQGGNTGASVFIFATEDGTISGWSPKVNGTNAVLGVDNSASGAVYKGLTLDPSASGTVLLAANFNAGKIDVFNQSFAPMQLAGSFTDPTLPAGYAPFDVAVVNGKVFVTYALQNAAKHDDVAGAGHGYIDTYDTNGNFLSRFASQGSLNSPWGLALAPASFGPFANDLLVGNFGDGHISAFDSNSGNLIGQLNDSTGNPISIDRLWGLSFGNGGQAGAKNTLFFTAGPNDETDGLFGSLQFVAPQIIAVGADAGGGPVVNVYNAATAAKQFSFFAYDASFIGGVRVAVGDLAGNGTPDVITAPGPGTSAAIHIYDGTTGQLLSQFMPFGATFTAGAYVAVGDVLGTGQNDIIVSADAGGGPVVSIFNGKDNSSLATFFAYPQNFSGGVRVAAGDVDADGRSEIITAPGPGGGPFVEVFKDTGNGLNQLQGFFAYPSTFTAGVYVASSDINGDGKADIVTGTGAGGGPILSVFSGADDTPLETFFAYDPTFTGGVRVAAITVGGTTDLITGPGPGGGPVAKIFSSASTALIDQFFAFDQSFTGGLYVAAG